LRYRRLISSDGFDLLNVPTCGYSLPDKEDEDRDKAVYCLWSGVAVSNALKELHSIEYSKHFAKKIPGQLFQVMREEFYQMKEWRPATNKKYLQEYEDYLKYFIEGCLPEKFNAIEPTLISWLVCPNEEDALHFINLLRHALVTNQTYLEEKSITTELERFVNDLEYPVDQNLLNQIRIKFHQRFRELLESNNIRGLVRNIQHNMNIEHGILLKEYFFKPISFMNTETYANNRLSFTYYKYVKNSVKNGYVLTTPIPFSSEISGYKVPADSAGSGSRDDVSGLKAGFFKTPTPPRESSNAANPSVAPKVENAASSKSQQIIALKLSYIFPKFYARVSYFFSRTEPLTQSDISSTLEF
jgi:hypothetical protein